MLVFFCNFLAISFSEIQVSFRFFTFFLSWMSCCLKACINQANDLLGIPNVNRSSRFEYKESHVKGDIRILEISRWGHRHIRLRPAVIDD